MAEYSGFFDGTQTYGDAEFARYFDNSFDSGISMVNDTTLSLSYEFVTGGIKIQPTFAIVKGYYYYLSEAITLPITQDNNYAKYARIVIQLNYASKKITMQIRNGTPSTSPKAPSYYRNNSYWELAPFIIYIPKKGSSPKMYADLRKDNRYCGVIRPKNLTEFNVYLNNCKEEWTTQGWRNFFIQETEPVDAVGGSLWMEIQ